MKCLTIIDAAEKDYSVFTVTIQRLSSFQATDTSSLRHVHVLLVFVFNNVYCYFTIKVLLSFFMQVISFLK